MDDERILQRMPVNGFALQFPTVDARGFGYEIEQIEQICAQWRQNYGHVTIACAQWKVPGGEYLKQSIPVKLPLFFVVVLIFPPSPDPIVMIKQLGEMLGKSTNTEEVFIDTFKEKPEFVVRLFALG